MVNVLMEDDDGDTIAIIGSQSLHVVRSGNKGIEIQMEDEDGAISYITIDYKFGLALAKVLRELALHIKEECEDRAREPEPTPPPPPISEEEAW